MIEIICFKLMDYLVSIEQIDEKLYEIYKFGFKQLINFIINVLCTIIIAFSLNMIIECLYFSFSYITLRVFAGGFHFNSKYKCFLFSNLLTIIAMELIKNIRVNLIFYMIYLISIFIILLLAPIEDSNRKLSINEKQVFTKFIQYILMVQIFLVIIFGYIGDILIQKGIIVAGIVLSVMLVLGLIKNKWEKISD